jgi:hypothetical protein
MANWSSENAHTWEDLLAAHEKWMRDYNFQKHLAHEKRDDGCHSPAAVLQWIQGTQPAPEMVSQAFSGLCETRRLNKAGYARFRNFLLYGERNLAGKRYRSISFKMSSPWITTRNVSRGTRSNGNRMSATFAGSAILVSTIIVTSLRSLNCGGPVKSSGL